MNMKSTIAIATFVGFVGASGAMAETWLPPAEIAPAKPTAAAAPSVATPAPTAPTKAAASSKNKEAKAKECKTQGAAKGLHGVERKKFIEDCKNS